jgi:hypothetical protein
VHAKLRGIVHGVQFEREEPGALTGVLDKYQLHSLYPLAALQAYLPAALKVPLVAPVLSLADYLLTGPVLSRPVGGHNPLQNLRAPCPEGRLFVRMQDKSAEEIIACLKSQTGDAAGSPAFAEYLTQHCLQVRCPVALQTAPFGWKY